METFYVFSPGYGRTAKAEEQVTDKEDGTTHILYKVQGPASLGSGPHQGGRDFVRRILLRQSGDVGNRNPMFRCWHITEDYFLLQMYSEGADNMSGTSAPRNELAIFKGGRPDFDRAGRRDALG